MAEPAPAPTAAQPSLSAPQLFRQLDNYVQRFLDRVAPHRLYRWLSLVALICIFLVRMFLLEGFYIITYMLFIFILNQFVLFLQPKDRAALVAAQAAASDFTDDGSAPSTLPTTNTDEFRPFVRRLPEFKFWYSCSIATLLAIYATFFRIFDIPVFWPVLVFYFVILFVATMRRQWLDMRRLKYVPWDIGSKRTYKSDPRKLSVKSRDPASLAQAAAEASSNATARPPLQPIPMINVATKKQGTNNGSPGAPAPSAMLNRHAPQQQQGASQQQGKPAMPPRERP